MFKVIKISAIVVFILLNTRLVPQSAGELAELYRHNRIPELISLASEEKIYAVDWSVFVEALSIEDAEIAIQKMITAYTKSDDRILKDIIRTRISQYYSARGYYQTSRQILENDKAIERIISIKSARNRKQNLREKKKAKVKSLTYIRNAGNYGLQLGAYSSYDNALKARQKYREVYSGAEILEKERNGRILYTVVIIGFASRQEAEYEIPTINKRFKVKGYVIQY